MAPTARSLSFGFPHLARERGERRDFLPALVRALAAQGFEAVVGPELGSGMGLSLEEYSSGTDGRVRLGAPGEAFRQPVVLLLRYPTAAELARMQPGATLVSMVHFPTRAGRIADLERRGLEAVSLDGIVDDEGGRLVQHMAGVAWNGLEAAFDTLERVWPYFRTPRRGPTRVTVLGTGEVGRHAVDAATKCGSRDRARALERAGVPGVEVVAVGRNLSRDLDYLRWRLAATDILVDATQRSDPSRPVVPASCLANLPPHAILCDLAVDPFIDDANVPVVPGLGGIPHGNLDEYVFSPDHPAWEELADPLPPNVRRTVVACYSWPGVHPRACMKVYGRQLEPLLSVLAERGGPAALRSGGPSLERALWRATLAGWRARCADGPADSSNPSASGSAPD